MKNTLSDCLIARTREELREISDPTYVDYICKCVPTLDRDKVIGVRSPAFKKFVSQYKKRDDAMDFLNTLPHEYYEENQLHAALICTIKNYDDCISEVERFLPYIDNWAVCDGFSPKCFAKNKEKVLEKVKEWIRSDREYTIRYAIKNLLGFFDDSDFDTEQLDLVASVHSEFYYVKMMIAWYFATALTFQYEKTVPYIENHVLADWEHRKAIQKAVESYCISDERKEYLKSLRKINK